MKTVRLNNGVKMPIIGFGVFQMSQEQCEECVLQAFQAGYRMIDTAAAYRNEAAVGRAIKKSGIRREELFIITKLRENWPGDTTRDAFMASLNELGLDYVDMYLIHQPYGDIYSAWRTMEELYEEGKVRAIGVSNFDEVRLTDLILNNKIPPAVDQVEMNPYVQRSRLLQCMQEYGVQAEAWAPLSQGNHGIFGDNRLQRIADKYGKTVAQVALRWNVQRGVAVIPKSTKKARILENIDIFDFELDEQEMQELESLADRNYRDIHDDPEFVKVLCSGWIGKG